MPTIKRLPIKTLDIPEKVSGRVVTNRGVHLQPFGFHGDWTNKASYWTDLMVSMGISWVVLITDGDSVRQTYGGTKSPLELLLNAGIIPIIREQKAFPLPFTEHDTVRWSVDLYGKYGLKPFWIIRNEPFDDREWVNKHVPRNAWEIIMNVWAEGANFIAANGGYIGFPDGPCYSFNPFESIKAYDCQWIFDEGKGYYTGHHYGKNRPRDYPYDAVTRHGIQLTEKAYDRLLDDFADDRRWKEEPRRLLNRHRKKKTPNLTALDDDVCWRGWELVAQRSLKTFGYIVPMAMTEGGWVPRDRPGSGPNTDIRMPHTTPKMVAKKTVQMYDIPSPFFGICPWLLADQDMGGSGWPFDAWHGWAYSEKYGTKKPVITTLQKVPPKEVQIRSEPLVIDVNSDTRDLGWVKRTFDARYRRGTSTLQLIELHEYQGPASWDVWVVDEHGLPVEGVPFYYHHSNAPAIDGDEWYATGELKTTGADGRLSFPAKGQPGESGTGQEAIWPQGKGDVLEALSMMGSQNRHLNGMWHLVEEGTPPLPDQPDLPDAPEHIAPGGPGHSSDKEWTMDVVHRPGPPIIAGTLPEAGIKLTISDPWGNANTVTSGSKPEHGPGGFEVVAPHSVKHTLTFLDVTFEIDKKDGSAFVTITKTTIAPPEPEPVVEPVTEPTPEPEPVVEPVTEPTPEPEPVVEPGIEPIPEPTTKEEVWALVLEKLARIEDLIAKLPPI